jgi:hypothetical protein
MNNTIRGIGVKIVLAAASGFCVAFSARLPFFHNFIFPSLYWLCLAGALFATGIFVPYLSNDRSLWFRCLGLIVVGAIGYCCAFFAGLWVVAELNLDERFGLSAGCLVAAAVVLVGARLIIPLTRTTRLALTGLVAAIVGGFVFWLTASLWQGSWFAWVIWHSLMAVAVHAAEIRPWPFGGAE